MNASELREKTVEELNVELITLSKQQFNTRMQQSTGQLEKSHELKDTKRAIARVKTLLDEKQRAALGTDENSRAAQ